MDEKESQLAGAKEALTYAVAMKDEIVDYKNAGYQITQFDTCAVALRER